MAFWGSLYRDPLPCVRLNQALTNFSHEPLVGQDGQGFLETLEVVWTDQNQSRPAITSHHDSFLLLFDAIGYLREMRLNRGEWHCLTHDLNYSHVASWLTAAYLRVISTALSQLSAMPTG